MGFFAGLDWGNERHAVCVVDEAGKVVSAFEVTHDANGLTELRSRFAKVAPAVEIPIAIERPTGLIVDALIEAGHIVVPIHPNVVKACRPRYRAAGGKDDRGDAYLLADVLRTDGHRLRPLKPQSDGIKALRAFVRTRDDLVAERVAIGNQLRAVLQSFWPGPVGLFSSIDAPVALAFMQRYPTPKSAAALGEKRLASFLAQHKYAGRVPASELLRRLRAAPAGLARGAEANAKGELVRMLARVLESIGTELMLLTARIEHEVAQLPEGKLMMSFPRSGRLNAAQIVSELGDVRERFQTEEQLAAEAGVAPVTHSRGKSRGVVVGWACNHHLRKALNLWAGNAAAPTLMPFAYSPAHGCGSSGALGSPERPTTPPNTGAQRASSKP